MKQHFVSRGFNGSRPAPKCDQSFLWNLTISLSNRHELLLSESIDIRPWKRTVTPATTWQSRRRVTRSQYACITRGRVHVAGTGSHFAWSEVNELCVNELGAEENDISRVNAQVLYYKRCRWGRANNLEADDKWSCSLITAKSVEFDRNRYDSHG